MKKVLRVISLIMAAAMFMTSCGTEKAKEVDGITTIKWYLPAVDSEGRADVQAAINNIIAADGLAVDLVYIDFGNYEQKMQMLNAGGEEYDLCYTANWFNNFYNNVSGGALADITELVPQYAPKLYASMKEEIWDAIKVSGKLYSVPNWQIQTKGQDIMIPEILLEETGTNIEDVKTLEDVTEYLRKVHSVKPEVNHFTKYWGELQFYYGQCPIAAQELPGAIYFDGEDPYKVINQFESPEFVEYVKLVNSWREEGLITSNYYTDSDRAAMPKGELRNPFQIVTSAPWNEATKSSGGIVWKAGLFADHILTTDGITCAMTGVSSTSKHPEDAVRLLEIVNTNPDVMNLIVYGIEGVNYNKVGENRVERIKNSNYSAPEHYTVASAMNMYVSGLQTDDVWEQTKQINDNAKVSPILGFVADTSMLTSELANCMTVINEQLEMLLLGLVPVEEGIAKLQKGLKDSGVDTVINEYQRQLDEWVKNNKQ